MLFLSYAAFITFWIIVAATIRISGFSHPPPVGEVALLEYPADGSVNEMEIGLFAENFYGFEPSRESFKADGWIWVKWSERFQQLLESQEEPPGQLIHLTNLVEDWDSTLVPWLPKPVKLKDGRFYQKYRFSGYFDAAGVDYHKYPFQTLSLPISIELADGVALTQKGPVQLVADRTHSGVGDHIGVSGYLFRDFVIETGHHGYPSTLGLELPGLSAYKSQVRFKVLFKKSPSTTFLKLLMPLVTVMTLTLFAPSLSATGWDVRVGIPPTALLSLIFLQQGYHDQLPDLSYLTYLDMIYNVCFLVNLVLFGLFLWGSNEYHSATPDEQEAVTASIAKIDRRFQIGLSLLVIFLLAANWFSISAKFGA